MTTLLKFRKARGETRSDGRRNFKTSAQQLLLYCLYREFPTLSLGLTSCSKSPTVTKFLKSNILLLTVVSLIFVLFLSADDCGQLWILMNNFYSHTSTIAYYKNTINSC